jgi:RNA polymerase sigma-70 factor (ECF subfamily)
MSSFEGQLTGWLYTPRLGAESSSSARSTAQADAAADQAIAALVEEYAQSLYRVAFSVTRNAAEAEDAVQETFLRVLKNKAKLSEIRNLRVWLVRITWNVVLDRKRRAKVRPETDDVADLARVLPCNRIGAESAAIASEGYLRILALIDTLPRKEREALLLSAIEELPTAEIASVLETSESSVRSRLFRARQSLAKMLASGPHAAQRNGDGNRRVNRKGNQ